MTHRMAYARIRLTLGSISLVIGLLAANMALFNWVEQVGIYYLLGVYSRYVCAYGGFALMIFGAMIINDFLTLRSRAVKPLPVASLAAKVDGEEFVKAEPEVIVLTDLEKDEEKTAIVRETEGSES
jgi:hypothetical protein